MIATNGLLFSNLTLREAVSGFAEVGFDAFELPHPIFYKGIFNGTASEDVRTLCSQLGQVGLKEVSLVSVNAANDFLKTSRGEFDEEVSKTKVVIDTATELGVKLVRVFVGEPKPGMTKQECREIAVRGIREITDYAEDAGVVLAMENHGRYSNDFEEEMAILNAVGSDSLRLNVDSGNYYWFGYTVREANEVLARASRFAVHVHLKNEASDAKDRRREPGQCKVVRLWEGDVDVAKFVRGLRDAGYKGAYSIEEEFEGMSRMTQAQLRTAVREDVEKLKAVLAT